MNERKLYIGGAQPFYWLGKHFEQISTAGQ
jgi:hypothetical protein